MLEHFIKAVLAENAILFDEEKFRLHCSVLMKNITKYFCNTLHKHTGYIFHTLFKCSENTSETEYLI